MAFWDEVLRHQRIVLVQVRHRRHEPAVVELAAIRLGPVRVDAQRLAVVGADVAVPLVDPVVARQIVHPPMVQPAVVDDHVHDEADAASPSRFRQRQEFLVRAEARVHAVEISGGIAVVGVLRHRVFQYRIQPNRGEAEASNVVQALGNALKIAAVPGQGLAAVQRVAQRLDVVVRRIAVAEAIRRDEIDRVLRRKSARALRIAALVQAVVHFVARVVALEADAERAGPRPSPISKCRNR